MKNYLFSDVSNPLQRHDLYLRKMNLEEMNASEEIKLMVANTAFGAMQNLRKNAALFQEWQRLNPKTNPDSFKQYKLGEALPLIKDFNIKPEEMCGFVLEDEKGRAVSMILAGISRDKPLRIMMGTIDTISEFEGRGYCSIMFDEVEKRVALENNGQLPQVLISERGATSLGNNFETYFHLMKSRGFEMQGVKRAIDPTRSFIPAELEEDKILFRVSPKISAGEFVEEKKRAKEAVISQEYQAFFMHGIPPKEMNLESFSANQAERMQEKLLQKKIYIDPTLQGAQVKSPSAENLQQKAAPLRSRL